MIDEYSEIRERFDSTADLLSDMEYCCEHELESECLMMPISGDLNSLDLKLSPIMQFEPEEPQEIKFPEVKYSSAMIGTLTPDQRREKIVKYLLKRNQRKWGKRIHYRCRKQVADNRMRIKGRFVTKEQAKAIQSMNGNK